MIEAPERWIESGFRDGGIGMRWPEMEATLLLIVFFRSFSPIVELESEVKKK